MSVGPKLDRRSFLGTTAAIGVGVGLGASISARAARARFSTTDGFPDRPVTVELELAPEVEGRGKAWLHIVTPTDEHIVDELGEIEVRAGRGTIATTLRYPYPERVAGQYAYHVEVAVQGQRITTDEPASYGVRKIVWFS